MSATKQLFQEITEAYLENLRRRYFTHECEKYNGLPCDTCEQYLTFVDRYYPTEDSL